MRQCSTPSQVLKIARKPANRRIWENIPAKGLQQLVGGIRRCLSLGVPIRGLRVSIVALQERSHVHVPSCATRQQDALDTCSVSCMYLHGLVACDGIQNRKTSKPSFVTLERLYVLAIFQPTNLLKLPVKVVTITHLAIWPALYFVCKLAVAS